MDRIAPQQGGMDIYNDDITRIQNNIETRFRASLIMLTSRKPTFIVEGIKKTGTGSSGQNTTVILSAGWVVVDGDLAYYPGGEEIFNQGDKLTFDTEFISDTATPSIKTKDNGSTYFAWQKKRAILQNGLSGDPDIDCCYFNELSNDIEEFIWRIDDVFMGKELPLPLISPTPQSQNEWDDTTVTATYRKDIWGYVHITGSAPAMQAGSGAFPQLLAQLPTGCRPSSEVRGMTLQNNISSGNSNWGTRFCKVKTDGVIQLANDYPTDNAYLQIPPFKAV